MILDLPSFTPIYLLAMLAGFFFSVWSGLFSAVSQDLRDLSCVFGVITFASMCAKLLQWFVREVNFLANQSDIFETARAEATARQREAMSRYTDRQIDLEYNLSGYLPEPANDTNLVVLDDGTAVDRQAILQIGQSANGIDLRPESQYTQNQAAVRYAYDALHTNKVIEAGRGSRGPKIIDQQQFELIIEMAKAKR